MDTHVKICSPKIQKMLILGGGECVVTTNEFGNFNDSIFALCMPASGVTHSHCGVHTMLSQ